MTSSPRSDRNSPADAAAALAAQGSFVQEPEEEQPSRGFLLFNAVPSWLASFLLNLSLILALALFAIKTESKQTVGLEAASQKTTTLEEVDFSLDDVSPDAADPLESSLSEPPSQQLLSDPDQLTIDTELTSESANLLAAESTSFEGQAFNELTTSELTNEVGGRGQESRSRLLQKYGGNAASENAVELALKWIADHQLADGGWNLDHTIGPTVNDRPRTSPNPGEASDARYAATALALLPFLGNGQTHRNGKYKDVVFKGLTYLMSNAPEIQGSKGLPWVDAGGRIPMYSHGLVTIVLGEAYAMTRDEKIREFLDPSITFIEKCQDPVGGGWRYEFQEAGDTSVVGWQVMALKSARLSGLQVNNKVFKLTRKFLDSVSIDYGAYYGYRVKPSRTAGGQYNKIHRARTAIGLLSRMYLGWDRDRRGIVEGVEWLSAPDMGPDTFTKDRVVDMYYNYYATQLMKHYGGEVWREWNLEMRDFLVETQEKSGPEKGSWMFSPDGDSELFGGRLYVTSLACMTLEVYYRYLPLYSDDATEDDFPLD